MILVTGAAGFIGFHVSSELLRRGFNVIGIDNINEYYDPLLKQARLNILLGNKNFVFYKIDICDFDSLEKIFKNNKIKKVCHLAAQAGVRYSLQNPFSYQKSNNEGFLNIIELSKRFNVENFVYASSSSVYGANTKLPFSEDDRVDLPISLYAATKRANELVAYTYSHLFNLACSGLRFFTVYGPWGRPDMALFIFTKSILEDKPIQVYNYGDMGRNFTYIDDIVDGVLRVLDYPVKYEIYNIGNDKAEKLLDFIEEIEKCLGKKSIREYLPMQPGDVKYTMADISKIRKLGYEPRTDIAEGIRKFIDWYLSCYHKK
ncbi:MAG: SDR family NAD(P)-dependent oxidoreductase [Chitinispirillaceae bacterium]|nr:SDR family NAD(P)-dependent oxidoreductase [Chitinispirillaceae bacterium]